MTDAGGEAAWVTVVAYDSGMQIKEYFLLSSEGLLSGIGGNMGLMLGASVISFIQVLYTLCLDGMINRSTGRK